jgi:hypothetical protein
MLELSPPLSILPLLRVAGLSGLNTIIVLISVRGCVDHRTIVPLKELGQLKKSSDLIGSRDSVVGTATAYGLNDRGVEVRVPIR